MGNGQKAQMKREKNSKLNNGAGKSQLKSNQNAKSIICKICRSTFLCTANITQLSDHATNKHNKQVSECFDGY
ncbi:DUF1909-domain-containing protein [Rozella allomycis CSF55]|uniref:DUF1909-domain-containing protein n=1 Tax=Rozella allomycis (strain CSF55) TaxID=988480 RepID=A0A4P9YG32_ROZAC|nr:DUF1909-domain-containing protein [Rozella allomycis CSF55]